MDAHTEEVVLLAKTEVLNWVYAFWNRQVTATQMHAAVDRFAERVADAHEVERVTR